MVALTRKEIIRTRPTAVALGNFDGVHLGHRRILAALRTEADRLDLEPVALTFDPHPREFLSPDKSTWLLTSAREKEEQILALGVEPLTLKFDADLAGLEADVFVREILMEELQGRIFFMGPAHRFGRGAAGDSTLLRSLIGESNRVREIPPLLLEDEVVSSSAIRHRLKSGDVDGAARMLGSPYAMRGLVVKGEGRGRKLGFPTANLLLEDGRKAFPAFGVYGGSAVLENGRRIPALGNIGLRPTFSGEKTPNVEVHVLGIDEDLYGSEMTFELHRRIRPEKAFLSVEELQNQIRQDVEEWGKMDRIEKK